MPEKTTDFTLSYDPLNAVLAKNREDVKTKLMELSPKAFTWFQRNSKSPVYLPKKSLGEIQVLFGISNVLGEVPPAQAEFRAFSKNADLGYYRSDAAKQLIPSAPTDGLAATGHKALNMSEYYQGKQRRATNGQFEYQCTITIPQDVWRTVESMGASIGIGQIIGILQQDPVLITQKSKQQGVRCIKPEPYGWIFSTPTSKRAIESVASQPRVPARDGSRRQFFRWRTGGRGQQAEVGEAGWHVGWGTGHHQLESPSGSFHGRDACSLGQEPAFGSSAARSGP